ncbi:MAG: PTS ascorbate transporter subunit IIC [Saprospiraceae bacterium]|nr:PTS ascorbate transporter subunit IIC [Saprospiraceae bacterium]|tara:strand:+ start:798 stop:974 length:177 start_codon:yes stop_codon:yes gene_type:complete
MGKKKFVLRIDEDVMKAVEKWAADEFRSVNGQLEWIVTRFLQQNKRISKEDKNVKKEE